MTDDFPPNKVRYQNTNPRSSENTKEEKHLKNDTYAFHIQAREKEEILKEAREERRLI